MYHFIRRNARSVRNLVTNCAACRGFQPVDPSLPDGNPGGGGAVDGGK